MRFLSSLSTCSSYRFGECSFPSWWSFINSPMQVIAVIYHYSQAESIFESGSFKTAFFHHCLQFCSCWIGIVLCLFYYILLFSSTECLCLSSPCTAKLSIIGSFMMTAHCSWFYLWPFIPCDWFAYCSEFFVRLSTRRVVLQLSWQVCHCTLVFQMPEAVTGRYKWLGSQVVSRIVITASDAFMLCSSSCICSFFDTSHFSIIWIMCYRWPFQGWHPSKSLPRVDKVMPSKTATWSW